MPVQLTKVFSPNTPPAEDAGWIKSKKGVYRKEIGSLTAFLYRVGAFFKWVFDPAYKMKQWNNDVKHLTASSGPHLVWKVEGVYVKEIKKTQNLIENLEKHKEKLAECFSEETKNKAAIYANTLKEKHEKIKHLNSQQKLNFLKDLQLKSVTNPELAKFIANLTIDDLDNYERFSKIGAHLNSTQRFDTLMNNIDMALSTKNDKLLEGQELYREFQKLAAVDIDKYQEFFYGKFKNNSKEISTKLLRFFDDMSQGTFYTVCNEKIYQENETLIMKYFEEFKQYSSKDAKEFKQLINLLEEIKKNLHSNYEPISVEEEDQKNYKMYDKIKGSLRYNHINLEAISMGLEYKLDHYTVENLNSMVRKLPDSTFVPTDEQQQVYQQAVEFIRKFEVIFEHAEKLTTLPFLSPESVAEVINQLDYLRKATNSSIYNFYREDSNSSNIVTTLNELEKFFKENLEVEQL